MSANWQNDQERKRLKLYVFGHIMQDRANPANIDAVRAYNLIDALFHDTKSVRDKWQDYYDSLGDSRLSSDEGTRIRDDKRTELLRAMAEDIGLGKDFSSVDFSRVYWPEGLEQERTLQLLQQQVTRHDLVERLNQQSLGGHSWALIVTSMTGAVCDLTERNQEISALHRYPHSNLRSEITRNWLKIYVVVPVRSIPLKN